jgi:hypothetical protein
MNLKIIENLSHNKMTRNVTDFKKLAKVADYTSLLSIVN